MTYASLDDVHEQLGVAYTEAGGARVPEHYGDVALEYRAARGTAVVVDLSARGRLRATGRDAARFLQGMLTRSVADLADGEGVHAALTTAKGETLADLRVFRTSDGFLLETEPGLHQKVKEALARFLIADDVDLQRVEGTAVIGLTGPGSAGVLASLVDDVPDAGPDYHLASRQIGRIDCLLVAYARAGWPRYDVHCPSGEAAVVWLALAEAGATPAGWAALDAIRIETGIPAYGTEADERVMPLECGLDDTVDFDKGCFIGQEALAKMHNRGQPRRHLVGLLVDAAQPPAAGAPVAAENKVIGWVTSSIVSPGLGRVIALASVARGFESVGAKLAVADGEPCRVTPLPFVAPPAEAG